MKASAEKSSSTVSRTTASRPFFAKAGSGSFFAPVNRAAVPAVQAKMTVGKTGDKFEREADKMADKVMRMLSPAASAKEEKIQRKTDERLQKAAKSEEKIQKKEKQEEKIQKALAGDDKLRRKGEGTPIVTPNVQAAIRSKASGGGQPLSADVRRDMEGRFNADFSQVRVHSDAEAGKLSNQLSARAFTHRNHIFFSRNQYQPGSSAGKQLLAHELTHTIQQGHAVQRSPQVSTTTTPPLVQRLGIRDALDYFADKANFIPGFRMLTLLLGFNPINMRSTDRSAANLLRALIELIPGGAFITQALDNHGVINKAAAWIEQKLATLGDIGGEIVNGLKRFVDSLSWSDIFDLGGVWERVKSIFTAPIARLISFGGSVVVEILKMVKDAILKPLAGLAQGTRGYDLLKAILGKDPITDEPYPPTAENLIGGFMKLIGQEEVWENIKKGNAIARAWTWFQGALSGLLGFARAIPTKIIATLTSLTFQDIVTVAGAFTKIVGTFVNIAVDFVSWGLNQVISLLEILVSVVAPGVMPYIKKAQAAFVTIIKNPVGFVGNLVRAGKLGFEMFAGNILTHLKTALIKWLVGPLAEAGVYIPKSFSLMEIIKLVLSVLGLTWQNIRAKLVKIIPDPVLAGLEKTASILVTLVKDGPAAAWEQIKAELTELKDQLIGQVTEMITTEVVKAAVTKLVSMLNPAGAVIQAIIAIYNTITFFIEKAKQIGAVVASFIDSISSIAAGQVAPAAKRVEQTLANTLVVVIGFLAKFAGLGNIPTKLVGIVKKVRQPIDKGLDKIVAWLGKMLKNLASRVLEGDPKSPAGERLQKALAEAAPVVNKYAGKKVGALILRPLLFPIKVKYQLTKLDVVPKGSTWHLHAVINPEAEMPTNAKVETEENAPVKVGEIEVTPTVKYATSTLTIGKESSLVGIGMEAEYLSPKHPQGSSPGDGEQASIFQYLPTDGKIPEGSSKKGGAVYIKGHLLNDNLGGPGIAKNLFPISKQANSDHKNKIEGIAKGIINNKGLLAFYRVVVAPGTPQEISGFKYKDNQMFKIDSTFTCILDTYKKADEKKLVRTNSPVSVTIVSTYTGGAARGKSEKLEGALSTNDAATMTNFNKDDVKWAHSHYEKKKASSK